MVRKCYICNNRLLSHSKTMTCGVCHATCHLKCLPNVNSSDSIYVYRSVNSWICTLCLKNELPFNSISDENEFINAISESWNFSSSVSFDELNSLVFNPFELNSDNSHLPIYDTDPDLQYFNDTTYITDASHCDYYLEHSFNKKCKSLEVDNECFSLMHLNIRSIPKNLDSLIRYLDGLDLNFTVIGLTETWLSSDTVDCYSIDTYQHFSRYRVNRRGGGVSLFINQNISAFARIEFSSISDDMETIFVEMSKDDIGMDKNVVIGLVYRPPNRNVELFNEKVVRILDDLNKENKYVYIMGDFNINLLDSKHEATSQFIDIIYASSLFPLITKPTRITGKSSTLIDNLYHNDIDNVHMLSGLLYVKISDHLPIFTLRYKNKVKKPKEFIQKRVFSEKNIKIFCERLKKIDWMEITEEVDGTKAFSIFYDMFTNAANLSFPLKSVKTGYGAKIPWLTSGLKKSIKTKNKMYKDFLKEKSDVKLNDYKIYKTNLNRLLKQTERRHYHELLKTYQNNSRKMWSVIKDVINKNKKANQPCQFNIGNKTETNKKIIANSFNSFFINVGPDLAKKIPVTHTDPLSYIKNRNTQSMFVAPVDTKEIARVITLLRNASSGYDDIHSSIIKKTYSIYLQPLTHLINCSLSQGFFPDTMKIAKVIPLYKSGDTMNISNYRPVSILPVFSKILERVMYDRLFKFINKHKILYKYQFGFREGYNTNMALIVLIDKISSAIDRGDVVVGVFLDFKKAFDTVDHTILLQKLEKYGIRGNMLTWFRDYLRNRKQFVCFNTEISDSKAIKCGVPQGSILGPLLFLLYVNDLVNVSQILLPILFADDTNIFITDKSLENAIKVMNVELSKIVDWLNTNKLSLNLTKTHFMVFKSKNHQTASPTKLSINDYIIEEVEQTKFIGVILDCKLDWSKHIMHLKNKVSKGIGILCKARKILPKSTLLVLYYAMIYPHFMYCIEVWGSAAECHISLLLILQKKTLRIITSSHYHAHTKQLFKDLKLLKLEHIYIQRIMIFLFKFIKGGLPEHFENIFTINRTIVPRQTRQSNDFHVPFCRTTQYQKTIKFQGVKYWNMINPFIDTQCSIHAFKKRLKNYLMENFNLA